MTSLDVARALPEISVLRDRCRALAMLDAVMSPEWDGRYYSFDSGWGPGEEMASLRNGSGDEWSIVFSPAGAFIRGFDHESEMSPFVRGGELWPGLVEGVPDAFASCVTEPAFSREGTLSATICLWRESGDDGWRAGPVALPPGEDPDGADWLFEVLVDGTPSGYQRFAEEYYETPADLRAISAVFALDPLTEALVERLNPETTVEELAGDIVQIGYPRLA
ncbi:hypothetical protein [Cellulomonas sp. ICMP 17802]|uniref:hypothetical protein n=1 Tax=Cellulomonas sp. ICMP 17802 TaxID=3239199 RepID=UPI00351BD8B7